MRMRSPSLLKSNYLLFRRVKLTIVISLIAITGALANSNQPVTGENTNENGVMSVQQQRKQISGTVTGSDGMPIPGVSVVVKGTTTGITTGMSGEFTLDIPADAQTLVFSFVGMKAQEIQIAGQTVFNVTMEDESIGLGEVVAIGYGSQQKKDITGAVGSVQSENFNRGVINLTGTVTAGKSSRGKRNFNKWTTRQWPANHYPWSGKYPPGIGTVICG